ncbi:MAG TPA: NAD(P)/FAD-dependent oxidoreductase [Actinomycetota bacterium]|nr:NAD(P)/FAD-dependent oxidoreductase [Actinomycetota bacterium]
MRKRYDAIVCGGGPAGLAAAMWLGRYRRMTLVVDGGEHRNRAAGNAHGYLTRDGATPAEIIEIGRSEIARYPTVERVEGQIDDAEARGTAFAVTITGTEYLTKRVLLATGVRDVFPDIPGFEELYGRHIHHCPCCDGYEARDESVLAIGWGEHVSGYALDLLEWGARVTVVTGGRAFEGDDACSLALRRNEVEIIEEAITRFELEGGAMVGAVLASGRILPATKAFFSISHEPRTALAEKLGCRLDELGYVEVGPHGETSVDGVYAAGDVTPGEQLVQAAAAEGAISGIACALSLRGEGTVPGAPDPGPDPELELEASRDASED